MKNLIFILLFCFSVTSLFAATPSFQDAFAQGRPVFVDSQDQLWVELGSGLWASQLADGVIKTVAVNKDGYALMVAELEEELRIVEKQYEDVQSKKTAAVMDLLQSRLVAVLADMETVDEKGTIQTYLNRTSKTDCLFDVHVEAVVDCDYAYASVDVFTHHCEFVGFVNLKIRNSWGGLVCGITDTTQGSSFNLTESCFGFGESSSAVARAYRVDDTSVAFVAVDRDFCGFMDRR